MNASLVHQAASLLLTYPGPDWPARHRSVRAALRPDTGGQAALLLRFCTRVEEETPLALAARYVATFDRSPRRTLHMTYYTDGDTRRRGGTLARLKARYRADGWQPAPDELPDHLPLMLEFAARVPASGRALLTEHRAALELLRLALEDYRSPYSEVLDAVCRTLPGPRPADRAAARRLARTGPPPLETVGLGPFPASASRGDRR
ncbi:nitrate reductase molybdenum cofactor assembly chaperone [Streptomyces sp. CB02923]|uniref:nitrate reductase molybdenum cofactor assembly chaperone n=1 Tax=Streptomyces sp. CB02923 TaxID=1718985 RepID=UPI00093A1FC6|nr:nitrate reductase molybdenum cofactor assembly chaperone [Streptomyces sp. CB02923]OKI02132.1 nitrate reductase molybdenum cofactor assembly chaperone [Streptomyces sp. CB02923]